MRIVFLTLLPLLFCLGCTWCLPVRIHEINAFESLIRNSARTFSQQDWNAFANNFTTDPEMLQLIKTCQTLSGKAPVTLEIKTIHLLSYENNSAHLRATAALRYPFGSSLCRIDTTFLFTLSKKKGLWKISNIQMQDFSKLRKMIP
ncbi:MAG: hypothetical protein RSD41_04275 [Kiritimatiellia bacterium]